MDTHQEHTSYDETFSPCIYLYNILIEFDTTNQVTTDLRPVTQRNKFSASAIEDVSMMGIAAEQLACLTIASCSFILTGANCGKRLVRITTVAGNKHSGDCAAGLTGILTSCQHLCLRCQHPREHGTGEFRFRSQVLSLLAKKQRKKKSSKNRTLRCVPLPARGSKSSKSHLCEENQPSIRK